MSLSEAAKAIYESELRDKLEKTNFGQFVAIEPHTREFYVAATFVEAALAAKQSHPERQSFVIRIGHEAAVHIGARAS